MVFSATGRLDDADVVDGWDMVQRPAVNNQLGTTPLNGWLDGGAPPFLPPPPSQVRATAHWIPTNRLSVVVDAFDYYVLVYQPNLNLHNSKVMGDPVNIQVGLPL